MRKGICPYCKSIVDISSDEFIECAACTSVMRVVGWNPIELELLGSGEGEVDDAAVDDAAEEVNPMLEQDLDRYHTAWRRFIAGFVDGIVLIPIGVIDAWALDPDRPPALIAAWLVVSCSAGWVYSVLMHGFYGQTLGKMACGVVVLDISEQPITMRQAFLRDIVFIVISTTNLMLSLFQVLAGSDINFPGFIIMQLVLSSGAFAWFMAEMLTMLTNEKRRAIHDFIAGTVVVKTESQSQAQDTV